MWERLRPLVTEPASRGVAAIAAATSALLHLLRNAPSVLLEPINFFDEGQRLANASFASKGLVLFDDYYAPYGPLRDYLGAAPRWLGLDSVVANRVVFLLVGVVLAALVTYLVARRRGLVVGGFIGLLAVYFEPGFVFTAETHALVLVFVIAALMVLEETRLEDDVAPLVDGGRLADRRALLAGLLLAPAAWVRMEAVVLVVVWLVVVSTRRTDGSIFSFERWMSAPLVAAGAPYLLILAAGGLHGMVSTAAYLLGPNVALRSIPGDWWAAYDVLRYLGNLKAPPIETFVATITLTASVVAVVLVVLQLVSRRPQLGWVAPYERDRSRTILIVATAAVVVWNATRYRPDLDHLIHAVLPIWLALSWSKLRWRAVYPTVAAAVAALTLVTFGLSGYREWIEFGDLEEAPDSLALIGRVPEHPKFPNLFESLDTVLAAWDTDGRPDPIFSAIRRNSYAQWNAPLVYYLMDVKPATWIISFDPGMADQLNHQRDMAEDLCATRAPAVLLDTPRQALEAPARFSNHLDRFLALNYRVVAGADDLLEYRRFARSSCLLPEDADRGDIESALADALATGDALAAEILTEWLES